MPGNVPTADVYNFLRAMKGLPSPPQNPTTAVPTYADLSGIQVAHQGQPSDQECSDLGILRMAMTVPGAPATYSIAAGAISFVSTSCAFAMFNASKVGRRFSPRRLKLLLTTAPTATVSLELAARIDDGSILGAGAPTAGNAAAVRLTNPNLDDQTQSDIFFYSFSGAVMTIPGPSARSQYVSRGRIPTGLGIVGDAYQFSWGGSDLPTRSPLAVSRATDVASISDVVDACTIGPGQWLYIYLWWLTAATSAPQFEWEFSGYEKQ